MIYFNVKTSYGVETVGHLERKDFKTFREYKKEIQRLTSEYIRAGMNVYTSQRSENNY